MKSDLKKSSFIEIYNECICLIFTEEIKYGKTCKTLNNIWNRRNDYCALREITNKPYYVNFCYIGFIQRNTMLHC